MEQKINIAELLKDCPKGIELDCTICNGVKFIELDKNPNYPIVVRANNGYEFSLTKYGQVHNIDDAKCVIFPKGKTTWEGFVPPCKFKDGDVVATTEGLWIGITTGGKIDKFIPTYCVIQYGGKFEAYLDRKESWVFNRLATEEEKQKLFQAIKDNGYYWNTETMTLERLIEPKFKVGDRIRSIISNSGYIYNVIEVKESLYVVSKNNEYDNKLIDFKIQYFWELVPDKFDVTTLVPFESRVLVRYNKGNKWCGSFFSHIDGNLHSHCYKYVTVAGKSYPMCIPYEGNEHLLDTTIDCDEFYKNW